MTRRLCRLLAGYPESKGEGISVAVVDSGVEASHPYLAGVPVRGVVVTEQGTNFSATPYDGVDVAGHGTACAGRILKLAPRVEIVSCRVLNPSIQATSRALLVALDWVVAEAIAGRIQVVNLSLGTPNRMFGLDIAERVDSLSSRGVPVVVSRGYRDRPDYPSAFGSPVSVTAERLADDNELVYYPDDVVEFGVRGYEVRVAWQGGTTSVMSGSSVAAPLVAGRLARFKSIDRGIRVWDLKSVLVEQAEAAAEQGGCSAVSKIDDAAEVRSASESARG